MKEKKKTAEQAAVWLREHPYSLLLLYLPVYLIAFFVIERLPAAQYHIIRCPLDRLIPFNQYMIIPYGIWYAWFPGWLLFFLLHSREEFLRLAAVMFTGMTLSLLVYVVWPNGIDLREPVTGTDLCSKAVVLLRETDTPEGVCPSIHISTITAVWLSVAHSRLPVLRRRAARGLCLLMTLLIAWSTMALKQHSVVDVIAGALLSVLLYAAYERLRR